ncbi:hypothetical protein HKBW3S09_01430, partial [Candidatus Hakubella thermalkaliphila]
GKVEIRRDIPVLGHVREIEIQVLTPENYS